MQACQWQDRTINHGVTFTSFLPSNPTRPFPLLLLSNRGDTDTEILIYNSSFDIVSTGTKRCCKIIIESASNNWVCIFSVAHFNAYRSVVFCLFVDTLAVCRGVPKVWGEKNKSVRYDNDYLGGLSLSSSERPIEASHYNQRPSSPLIRPLTNKLWLTPPSDYCNHPG